MKATGIVRRIDDLGRVVIPKEIRRTLRIREGDPLEIYTDKDGEVIFKKYSMMGGLSDFAGQICETLYKTSNHPRRQSPTGRITPCPACCAGMAGEARSPHALEGCWRRRRLYQRQEGDILLPVTDSRGGLFVSMAAPILAEGDVMGCLLFADTDGDQILGETEYALLQTISGFLGRHMET